MLAHEATDLGAQVELVDALEPLIRRGEGLPEVGDQGVVPAPGSLLIVSRRIEIEVPSDGVLTPGSPVSQRGLGKVEAGDASELPRLRSFLQRGRFRLSAYTTHGEE